MQIQSSTGYVKLANSMLVSWSPFSDNGDSTLNSA